VEAAIKEAEEAVVVEFAEVIFIVKFITIIATFVLSFK